MRYLALILALVCGPALADLVASNGSDSVRLMETECSAKLAALVSPQQRDMLHAATATLDGREWMACWALLVPGYVSVLYEDGDQGQIPMSDFKPAAGA